MNKKHLGDNYAPTHTSTPFKQHLSGVSMELNKIHCGDAAEVLRSLPTESVNCVVNVMFGLSRHAHLKRHTLLLTHPT